MIILYDNARKYIFFCSWEVFAKNKQDFNQSEEKEKKIDRNSKIDI